MILEHATEFPSSFYLKQQSENVKWTFITQRSTLFISIEAPFENAFWVFHSIPRFHELLKAFISVGCLRHEIYALVLLVLTIELACSSINLPRLNGNRNEIQTISLSVERWCKGRPSEMRFKLVQLPSFQLYSFKV